MSQFSFVAAVVVAIHALRFFRRTPPTREQVHLARTLFKVNPHV